MASSRRSGRPRLQAAIRRHPAGERGRCCPVCGGKLSSSQRSSSATSSSSARSTRSVRRDVPRRGRPGEAARDGQLRHRPGPDDGRDHRAAPRRRGIQWPASVAPYDVHVVVFPAWTSRRVARRRAFERRARCLLDDRDARAGEKFADADLIGCPVRVTVGRKAAEDGTVDVRERAKGDDKAVSVGELVSTVREMLG